MNRVFKRALSLHEDRDGQAIVIIALVLFTIVLLFAFTVNVGHRMTAKVEAQNTADAAVLSGAMWYARGLNLITICNVGMTECLAMVIMFRAFKATIDTADISYWVNVAAAEALKMSVFPPTMLIGDAWKILLDIAKTVLDVAKKIAKELNKLAKKDGALWDLMGYLQDSGNAIKSATPYIAAYEASRIAELNGADAIVDGEIPGYDINFSFYYALLLPFFTEPLPVTEGEFQDLCKPTIEDGGPGYKNFLHWDKALDMTLTPLDNIPIIGGTSIQDGIATITGILMIGIVPNPGLMFKYVYIPVYSQSICGSEFGPSPRPKEEITVTCSKCEENTNIENADWKIIEEETEINGSSCDSPDGFNSQYNSALSSGWSIDDDYDIDHGWKKIRDGCDGEGCKPCEQCKLIERVYTFKKTTYEDGESDTQYKEVTQYFRKRRVLNKCRYETEVEVDSNDDPGDNEKPKPLKLEAGWEDMLKYTVLTRKKISDKIAIGGGDQADSHPDPIWTTSQAKVYNPTEETLFNQDWRACMKPWLLEDVKLVIGGKDLADNDTVKGVIKKASDWLQEIMVH